jgi:hypothetical protein
MARKTKKTKPTKPARKAARKPARKPARKAVRKPARSPKRKSVAQKSVPRPPANPPAQRRLWLMYPPKLIQQPLIWELGKRFKVVTNIRQASVTDEIGIVCLEVDGKRDTVKSAIQWLEKSGVNVEPVEINVIES